MNCWIFGKVRKLKIDNIYWNKLFQSFESLNCASIGTKEGLHQIKTLHSGKKLWQHQCDSSENLLRINTNFQSRGSKIHSLIRYTYVQSKYTYLHWLAMNCTAMNLICLAWNLKTAAGFNLLYKWTCKKSYRRKLVRKPKHDTNKNFK